jgi:hypothetical protein
MPGEDLVDFSWGDLLAALIDDFLETPGEEKISLGIKPSLVACSKPTIGEGGG